MSQASYQPFGTTTGWSWGNGTTMSREYDADGQLIAISSAGNSTYTFNDDGTIESRSDDFAESPSWTDGTTTFTVSSTSNRLQSATGQIGRTYGYDAAGNTTGDGARTFTYNDAGRMKTSTSAGVTTTYSYNWLGERVKKINTGATIYFAYDEAGRLIGEYDTEGDLIQETVWFGDIPVATLKPNVGSVSVFYVHTDHLNTPRRITRPSDNAILGAGTPTRSAIRAPTRIRTATPSPSPISCASPASISMPRRGCTTTTSAITTRSPADTSRATRSDSAEA